MGNVDSIADIVAWLIANTDNSWRYADLQKVSLSKGLCFDATLV